MVAANRLNAAQIIRLAERGQRGQALLRAYYNTTQTPLERFQPRPDNVAEFDQQTGFLESKAKFSVLLGGTGSGKTLCGCVKTARYILNNPPPRPRCPFWIIGYSFEKTCAVCWTEKLSQFILPSQILSITYHSEARNWPSAVVLRHPHDRDKPGWVLEFKSWSQGMASMTGESIGGFWANEEIPLPIIYEIMGRCRDYNSPGWADFTPIEVVSPEWPDLYDDPPEGWQFFHLNVEKNTHIDADWRRRFLASFPEDERETRRIGVFASYSGQVFKEWRRNVHVIDEFVIPHDWKRLRGIDFGFNNPFACVWVAKDRDGRYFVYDEHYAAQRLNSYHAEQINKRWWDYSHPSCGPTYSDHDAQQRAELQQLGIQCVPANKSNKLANINRLRSLMVVQDDGKARFYVFRNCVNLIKEIRGYHWPPEIGTGVRMRSGKELPVDHDDHCLVADTQIATDRGSIPIKDVGVGDSVWTRQGWKPVLWSGPTRFDFTHCIQLSNDSTLEGTAEHPVWVIGRGWTPLGQLRTGDVLCSTSYTPQQFASFSTAYRTDAIQTRTSRNCAATSCRQARAACIEQFGNTIGVQSPKVTTFTTRTATRSITGLQILNAFTSQNTARCTLTCGGLIRNDEDRRQLACAQETSPAQCTDGWQQKRVKRNTGKQVGNHGRIVNPASLFVGNAVNPSRPGESRPFVRQNAMPPRGGILDATMKRGRASNAGLRSSLIDTEKRIAVPVRVLSVYGGHEKKQTYDLTVADAHEFFANGVLVHNCIDASLYAVVSDLIGEASAPKPIRRQWQPRKSIQLGGVRQ